MLSDERSGSGHNITVRRAYPAQRKAVAAAGAFAQAVVIAAVTPMDWQIGEDAEHAARNLVHECLDVHGNGPTVTVEVTIDLQQAFIDVAVYAGRDEPRRVRVAPRRPFTTRDIEPLRS